MLSMIDRPMDNVILGISAFYHDAAALLKNGAHEGGSYN